MRNNLFMNWFRHMAVSKSQGDNHCYKKTPNIYLEIFWAVLC